MQADAAAPPPREAEQDSAGERSEASSRWDLTQGGGFHASMHVIDCGDGVSPHTPFRFLLPLFTGGAAADDAGARQAAEQADPGSGRHGCPLSAPNRLGTSSPSRSDSAQGPARSDPADPPTAEQAYDSDSSVDTIASPGEEPAGSRRRRSIRCCFNPFSAIAAARARRALKRRLRRTAPCSHEDDLLGPGSAAPPPDLVGDAVHESAAHPPLPHSATCGSPVHSAAQPAAAVSPSSMRSVSPRSRETARHQTGTPGRSPPAVRRWHSPPPWHRSEPHVTSAPHRSCHSAPPHHRPSGREATYALCLPVAFDLLSLTDSAHALAAEHLRCADALWRKHRGVKQTPICEVPFCALCGGELRAGQASAVIPCCDHVYHADCIDGLDRPSAGGSPRGTPRISCQTCAAVITQAAS
eukprot:TRINITY_DN3187_c0_g1_i2.p1 TRINITY_DN3187_c0_g1~~TRINITY_DN3187_c0_g1_i2.p1  ORF type:complete len:447 (+),score=62.63 TRINITY_DN3187_c0_g1_i2:107-1342(+)